MNHARAASNPISVHAKGSSTWTIQILGPCMQRGVRATHERRGCVRARPSHAADAARTCATCACTNTKSSVQKHANIYTSIHLHRVEGRHPSGCRFPGRLNGLRSREGLSARAVATPEIPTRNHENLKSSEHHARRDLDATCFIFHSTFDIPILFR